VAMAVAAVAVLPAYESLHRIANRVAFGQVLDPTEALRALAQGLEQVAPAGELDQVADVIVRGTRATEASVWLEVDGALERVAQAPRPTALEPRRTVFDGRAGVASWAKAVGADHAAAIVHDGRLLGLIATVLPPLVSLPPNECRLLDDLAAEAGLLAHNAAMVSELARHVARLDEQAAELRLSCQRIVAISDQERRALERDLHDGAQQDLVGLLMRLGALAGPPTPVQRTDLTDLVEASRAAVVERCGGGLPARLLTDGLGPALLAATAPMQATGLVVDISVHLTSRPPPDIEGSVYFCCLEALQNAAKHAHATIVRVDISADGPYLQFNVVDNGVGFSALPDRHGSGLRHLNERLAVIGGAPTVWSAPGAGTTVTGRIPLAESARSQ
jgi:signal transduction histidine kinase